MAKHNFTPRKNFNEDGTRNTSPFILGWYVFPEVNGITDYTAKPKYVEREVTPLRKSRLDTDHLIADRRAEPDYDGFDPTDVPPKYHPQAPTTRELEDLQTVLGGGQ